MNVTVEQQSQQIGQIAAIQAAAVGQSFETPPQPSYGEPQARPAYEALRTLKRGMTADEVARLVGNPVSSETLPGGNIVWDYGYGRTITFDTRGTGRSPVPDEPYGISDLADDAARILDGRTADVVGFSMGGYVALTLALARPDLVRKLVLAGTGAGGPSRVPRPPALTGWLRSRPGCGGLAR